MLKGSRCEKRDSAEAASGEEMFGPPVAVPFKWEEEPGKAKPKEADKRLQIQNDDDFYRLLMSKEGKLGYSSRSLYRPTDAAGRVPFDWEDEPGRPKTPARNDLLPAALAPPPSLQSPARASPHRSRSSSHKLMKWIFQGKLKSAELNKVSRERDPSGYSFSSQELSWLSESSRIGSSDYSSDISSKTTSSACSSRTGSPRRRQHHPATGCFPVSPARVSMLSRNDSKNQITSRSLWRTGSHTAAGYFCLGNRTVIKNLTLEDEKETETEFHDAHSDFVDSSRDLKPGLSITAADSADRKDDDASSRTETDIDLETLMRFASVKIGNKNQVVPQMQPCKISEPPRGFLACLPLCSTVSHRAKIYGDCMESNGRQLRWQH